MEKGKIERQIRYLRDAFFAARAFRDVDDLNAQFRRWGDDLAHQRPHPDQRDRTVAAVFAEEQARLLPPPAHPFETDALRAVVARKQPYVAFDRNRYSIPHTHVRRPLTAVASPTTTVRIVDGADELGRHVRSYDTGQTIEDPTHLEGLVAATGAVTAGTTRDRLRLAVPLTATLLERLAIRADALRPHLLRLQALLADYGPKLSAALALALERNALCAGSISHILETHRRHRTRTPPMPVVLPDDPGVRALTVTPHLLEPYDALSRLDPDDPER